MDLRELDIAAWRAQVGAVFQNFGCYAYTIRENIGLADLANIDDTSRMHAAAEQAGFAHVAAQLERGYETYLGKEFGGAELSGGQWQKLAVVRALFRNASVLILDEPTAALDPRSEHELYTRFAMLAKGRTTFLITHRLGSVQIADRILVFKEGRLVEHGTHAELVALNGEYADLWRMQAEKYVPLAAD